VGIGTSSPGAKLQVVGTVAAGISASSTGRFRAFNPTNDRFIEAYNDGTNSIINSTYGSAGASPLTFQVTDTERARIDSSGNLLVGKTSSDLSTPGFGVDIRSGVLNGVSIIKNDGQWGTALFIRRNTGVGTGAVAEFNYDGTTTGTIGITATTTAYNTSSDYRLKDNVQPMTGALAKVAALKPCAYTWKADGSNGQGFIAHELAEVVPDAVTGEKDAVNEDGSIKPQGIDTSFLVATLTAGLQEAVAMIEELKAKVAALEAE
jgi:hypothetical protein